MSNRIDIMALTETWLCDTSTNAKNANDLIITKILEDKFLMMHNPRTDGRTGGGVAIIFRKALNSKIEITKTHLKYKQFESLSSLVRFPNTTIRLSVIYRPKPTRANNLSLTWFWKEWKEYKCYHMEKGNDFLILGDLNFHLDISSNSQTRKFNNILSEFGLTQHVGVPTHIHGHTLDVVITTEQSNLVSNLNVSDYSFVKDNGRRVKDHFTVEFNMNGQLKQEPEVKFVCRDWKAINLVDFQSDLLTNLNELSSVDSTEQMIKKYNKTLNQAANLHAPAKTKTLRRKPNQWYSEELKELKRERRRKERLFKRTRSNADFQSLRSINFKMNKKVRLTKISYVRDLVAKCGKDKKKIFSLSNKLMGYKKETPCPEGDPEKLANEFSQFFLDKVRKIQMEVQNKRHNRNITCDSSDISQIPMLPSFVPSSQDEINSIIASLPNKQCMLDLIPTWVLKENALVLTPVITKIVNTSLMEGIVPPQLKRAIVRPLLKDNNLDTNNLQNYRPVSNLPILSKILEKVVHKRLTEHISTNNLLDPNQSAYRKDYSTETMLIKMQNDILCELDKGHIVAVVMIDVSAAFDTVSQEYLLQCFTKHFGISGKALEWMKSYLSNRTQSVLVKSFLSTLSDLECGFPQGAILAGLFYNMFSAPLKNVVKTHEKVSHKGYADDNSCYIAFNVAQHDNATFLLNDCLEDMMNWMVLSGLKVNEDKTKLIYFTPNRNINTDVIRNNFGQTDIKPDTVVKHLGFMMDSLMSCEKQINVVTKSVYFQIKNISKIRQFLDLNSTKSLVQALIISRLDYCNSLYVNLPQRLLQKLQYAQNTAARLIMRKSKRCRITPVLKHLHWLPIASRIKFKLLVLTYKCLINRAPQYLKLLLTPFVSTRVLRSNQANINTLFVPTYKKRKHGGRAFLNIAPRLWNLLPLTIRQSETLDLFKSLLKTHLFTQHFGN